MCLDFPGRDPVDPGRADHGPQSFEGPPPGLQQRGIERASTQLRDRQLELPSRDGQTLRSHTITARGAGRGSFVAVRADLHGRLGIDEVPEPGLEESAEQLLVREVEVLEQITDESRQGRLMMGSSQFPISWSIWEVPQ